MATEEELRLQEALNKAQETSEEHLERSKKLAEEKLELQKGFESLASKIFDTQTERLATDNKILEVEKRQLEESQRAIELKLREVELSEEELELEKAQLDQLKKQTEVIKKKQKETERAAKTASEMNKFWEGIGNKVGLASGGIGAYTAEIIKAQIAGKSLWGMFKGSIGMTATVLDSFIKGASETFTVSAVLGGIFDKLITANIEYLDRAERAQANFVKATGAANVSIRAGMDLAAGVNFEEASQAAIELTNSYKGFLDLQGPSQAEMQKSAGRLAKLGANTSDYGNSIEHMTKALGFSGPKATKIFEGVASAAGALGMTTGQATAQFTQFQGTLALYGPRVGKKFREIAAAAKASGLEISEVVSLGEQFDTFEGATKAVGQLNAYLGGPVLDSMEMFYLQTEKGPEAVQKHVVETLKAQGKSIETMNYSEQKAFAETLNMKVDGFQKLMGYQSEESRLAEKKAKQEQNTRERYMKSLRRVLPLAERIAIAIQGIFANKELQAAFKELSLAFIGLFGGDTKNQIQTIAIAIADAARWLAGVMKDFRGNLDGFLGFFSGGSFIYKLIDPFKRLGGLWDGLKKIFGGGDDDGPKPGVQPPPGPPGGPGPGTSPAKPVLVKVINPWCCDEGVIKKKVDKVVKTGLPGPDGIDAKEAAEAAARTYIQDKAAQKAQALRPLLGKVGGPVGKQILKKLPGIGLMVRLGSLGNRLMKGDFSGAGLETAAGLSTLIPGWGTAAAFGIDAYLTAKDIDSGKTSSLMPDMANIVAGEKLSAVTAATTASSGALAKAAKNETPDQVGQKIATAFVEEMKKNNEPVNLEIKLTADDMFGANSPVHKWVWDSVNRTMVEKTA